jgi:outer membrane protein assembly factor BamA
MNFGIDEKNLLGLGKSLSFDISKDHQRTTWGFTYNDPQFLGSRWNLMAQDQYLSDGFARAFSLGRPFYALDTPWSTSVALNQKHTSLYLYDRGTQIFQTPFIQTDVQWTGAAAFHEARDRVWRAGVSIDRQDTQYGDITRTGPPDPLLAPALPDRRLRGAALTLATQKDAFESFYDFLGMDTPEDYNLAWNGSLQIGSYSRVPASGLANGQVNLTLVQYYRLAEEQLLAGMAAVDVACRLDPENWYYVGGDQGLRGFPNQLRPGDARWIVSAEYRLLTEQRWWGLVRLGYNAFVDVGAVRQFDGQGWTRPYSDLGVGLRLGNLKSSLGRVILLSVAAPLNREPYQARYQLTIGNSVRF